MCRVLRRAREVRRERSGGVRDERGDWECWAWGSVGEGERRGDGWPERERRISWSILGVFKSGFYLR